jgi:proteasome lid subunit RPN8/RPN11
MTSRVELPAALAHKIRSQTRAAGPAECCGLIEGVRQGEQFRVTALHPARNLSADPGRFEINPSDQFAAQRAARARGTQIIGCYHSHPHGSTEPSEADLVGAGEENFLWLIAGGESLKAFVYLDGAFTGLVIGADWVTSSE